MAGLAIASAKSKKAEIAVRLDLGLGKATGRALGCDLTFDYVKINAEYYSGPAAAGAAGAVPEAGKRAPGGVNRPVIVEALSYIRKFGGKRAVIKYGGAAMVDPALKRSFAEEVVLLQSAGLKPVIVHGGGPEITKTLEGECAKLLEALSNLMKKISDTQSTLIGNLK
jgi:acetylglutamate kinase